MGTFINGVYVPATHHKSPILGNAQAGGGLFKDMPLEHLTQRTHSTFFQDFHTNLLTNWVATEVGTSGTIDVLQDEECGILRMASTTANEGYGSVQYTGADLSSEGIAIPQANRIIAYEARVQCNDWTNCDWFIGLAMTDTTCMSAAGALLATGMDTHVGFTHLEAGSGVPILTYASTAVASKVNPTSLRTTALANDTWVTLGIRIEDTTRIQFFINQQPVSAQLTAAAALGDAMTPTFCMIANGSAINFDVDYVLVCQTR